MIFNSFVFLRKYLQSGEHRCFDQSTFSDTHCEIEIFALKPEFERIFVSGYVYSCKAPHRHTVVVFVGLLWFPTKDSRCQQIWCVCMFWYRTSRDFRGYLLLAYEKYAIIWPLLPQIAVNTASNRHEYYDLSCWSGLCRRKLYPSSSSKEEPWSICRSFAS